MWPSAGELEAHYAWGEFEGTLRQLIHQLKYRRRRAVAPYLTRLALETMPRPDADLLIPVPLFPARLREREFNQSWLLGRELARGWGLSASAGILQRVRNTATQTDLTGRARLENVREAFAVTAPVGDQHVLLVDDVHTTGATAQECARVLKRAGARAVSLVTLAQVS